MRDYDREPGRGRNSAAAQPPLALSAYLRSAATDEAKVGPSRKRLLLYADTGLGLHTFSLDFLPGTLLEYRSSPDRLSRSQNAACRRPSRPRTPQSHRTRRRPDRETVREGRDHAAGPEGRHRDDAVHLDRVREPRLRPRHRRRPARARRRDLRAGIVGQNNPDAADHRGSAEAWRHGGVRRRRACARRPVCSQARGRSRQPARVTAG